MAVEKMNRHWIFGLVVLSLAAGPAWGQPGIGRAGAFDAGEVLLVRTSWPVAFEEVERTWTRKNGKDSFVARLGGRTVKENVVQLIFYFQDGTRVEILPDALAMDDRAYALQKTSKRVNRTSVVLLGKIARIRHGDSFLVHTIANQEVMIRLDGIDSPDSTQPDGPNAIKWLERFVGQDVRVEYFEIDKYKRVVGNVYVGERWLNYEMVLAGQSWHDHRNNVDGRLAAAEKHAESGKRGMWKNGRTQTPWDYREQRARERRQSLTPGTGAAN